MSKKRCITVLLCLLTASVVTASFFLIPEFRSLLTGLLMLFSQRSVQSLQGAINASAFPFFYAAFLHTALSLLVPSQADNSRCLLPRYFPRNGCLPRGRFSSMPAMLFHRETFTCPAEREKAFKEYKRLFGLCHWPGCKHDVFGVFRTCMLTIGCAPFIIACAYMGLLYRNAFRGCSVFSFMQSTQLVFTE